MGTPDGEGIGYRRPPKHAQFKKGHSGNPRGRPKGPRNLKTDLEEELGETIRLREGGVERRLSKQRALIKGTLAKAIGGDQRATATILRMVERWLDEAPPPESLERSDLSDADLSLLEAYMERRRAGAGDTETSR